MADRRRVAAMKPTDSHGELSPGQERDQRVLLVDVSRISTYDRNPRVLRNPEYDRIKASIRANGMDQPLLVTQRPGDDDYTVHSGGNTRLQIVKDLFEQTGDERFRTVHCVFKPWTSESDVLLGHLRENDLRGGLTFIDRARAILGAKALIELEAESEPMSQRRMAEVLRDRGYHTSQTVLSHMQYAVERLLPALPVAVADMSRGDVERVRKLDSVVQSLWNEIDTDSPEDYTETFNVLCRRYDGPDWHIDNLRFALEAELVGLGDLNIQRVRAVLHARLAGETDPFPLRPAEGDGDSSDESSSRSEEATADSRLGPAKQDAQDSGQRVLGKDDLERHDSGTAKSEPTPDAGTPVPRPVADHTRQNPPQTPSPEPASEQGSDALVAGASQSATDLKSLRARCWTLAERLAQRNALENLVKPLPNAGLGFVLTDVPDQALAETLDDDALALVSTLWWQLAACCELTYAPLDQILPHLRPGSVLFRAMENGDANLLFDNVWTLDPGNAGARLWSRLDELGWADLLSLMQAYQTLHKEAQRTGQPVWADG